MKQILIIIVMIVYLLMMVYIGFSSSKKSKNTQSEFYLAGRKMGPIVTAMSAEASDMSSWLLMGLPGLAYLTGLADPFWTALGLALGTYFNWLIVSKRLRRYSAKLDAITVPDFFSKRFNDKKNIIAFIAAIIILIFFIPYSASGFKAIGTLFNSLFNVDYHIAMIIGAIIIIFYTVMGGFLAVSTTDLIQSIVMTIALFAIVMFGINQAGGIGNVIDNAKSLVGYLSLNSTYNIATGETSNYGFITILSTLAWGLGYFGMPHILLRFMAIENEDKLVLSRRIETTWVVISMGIAILIGFVGYSLSLKGLIPLFTTSSDSETVIIKLAYLLSQNGILAAIVAGLTMSGILACTMSTADSQLLAASSSFSKNILQDFFHLKLSDKKALLIAKLTVVVIAIIAVFLAWNPDSSVFTIVSFAWAGFGATFGPLMLCCLFWKKTTKEGALAGLLTGGIMVFVWKFIVRPIGGIWNIYELLPAFIVSLLFIFIVSLVSKKPNQEVIDTFESIK